MRPSTAGKVGQSEVWPPCRKARSGVCMRRGQGASSALADIEVKHWPAPGPKTRLMGKRAIMKCCQKEAGAGTMAGLVFLNLQNEAARKHGGQSTGR